MVGAISRQRAEVGEQEMDALHREIHQRWRTLFRQLAAGDDAPPGQRLRTEGLMEAAELTGLVSPAQLQAEMEQVYEAIFLRPLVQDFGPTWRDLFPFPQIPAMAQRAPVYPSTSE
jgi:hypothetical protein